MKDRMARAMIDGAIASGALAPEGMVAERGAFWTNQFENHDQAGGCRALGRRGVGAARA
jgi:cysteine synthase